MLVKRSSPPEGSERLKGRRRRERRRLAILLCVLFVVSLSAFIWLTWQPYVRISKVSISNDSPVLLALVEQKLVGTYVGISPRNSVFLVPERAIRSTILDANPGLQAVSVTHNGLTGIIILLHERVPVARWCGLSITVPTRLNLVGTIVPFEGEYCYLFDATGYIYAAADPSDGRAGVATSTAPLNSFAVYDPLAGGTLEPLRATLSHAKQLPNLFDFARKISSLGSPVDTITIRDDETDLLLESNTRVTYVLGTEEAAFTDLVSAKASINLSDGSLLYIDLRFPGKVYLKRKGE